MIKKRLLKSWKHPFVQVPLCIKAAELPKMIQQLMRTDNANEPINRLTEKVDMCAAGLFLYEMCSNFKT